MINYITEQLIVLLSNEQFEKIISDFYEWLLAADDIHITNSIMNSRRQFNE